MFCTISNTEAGPGLVDSCYIAQILDEVEHNPAAARKSLRTAWETATGDEFRTAAVPFLTSEEGPGQRFLVSFLLQNGNLEKNLADHTKFTREEAVVVARAAHRVEPSLDVKLAVLLAGRNVEEERDARRVLEILEAISQPASLLPLMSSIMQHPNAKVRSKAALLMGKGNRNAVWARQQLTEPDERVRANAVESVWGLDGEDACQMFQAAARNRSQRTAINGMLGLYLCGKTESVQLLADAGRNVSGAIRTSAAWGMGRTQDPRFLSTLTKLVRDTEPLTRSNALKAMGKIRNYRALIERQGVFRVRLSSAVCRPDGTREFSGVVHGPAQAAQLNALHYAAEENGQPIFRYEVVSQAEQHAAVGVALPHGPDLDEGLGAALAEGWKQVLEEKQAGGWWSTATYSNHDAGQAGGAPHGGFFQALNALFHQLPQRSHRALVVVGSPMSESSDVVMKRQGQLERFIKEARDAHVRIFTIAPPVCAPIMRMALSEVARGTGGKFVETSREEGFSHSIANVILTLFPTFELRYKLCEPAAPKVRLLIHSPNGVGECEAELAAG